jgi:hypothetical protein
VWGIIEIYVLEMCHTFAADWYAELFEPTPLGTAHNTVWFCSWYHTGKSAQPAAIFCAQDEVLCVTW